MTQHDLVDRLARPACPSVAAGEAALKDAARRARARWPREGARPSLTRSRHARGGFGMAGAEEQALQPNIGTLIGVGGCQPLSPPWEQSRKSGQFMGHLKRTSLRATYRSPSIGDRGAGSAWQRAGPSPGGMVLWLQGFVNRRSGKTEKPAGIGPPAQHPEDEDDDPSPSPVGDHGDSWRHGQDHHRSAIGEGAGLATGRPFPGCDAGRGPAAALAAGPWPALTIGTRSPGVVSAAIRTGTPPCPTPPPHRSPTPGGMPVPATSSARAGGRRNAGASGESAPSTPSACLCPTRVGRRWRPRCGPSSPGRRPANGSSSRPAKQ